MNPITIAIFIIIALIFVLALIKKDSKYSEVGINIKRVYCPKCNLKQPIIRKPKNEAQVLFGGYTCKNCNTEMDKYGVERNS